MALFYGSGVGFGGGESVNPYNEATGGDQSPSSGVIDGNYKYHTFTTTGSASFQITSLGSSGNDVVVYQ